MDQSLPYLLEPGLKDISTASQSEKQASKKLLLQKYE